MEALSDTDFPSVHAASYVLELAGFNDSRWTVSQRLGLTSASLVPAALLWAGWNLLRVSPRGRLGEINAW